MEVFKMKITVDADYMQQEFAALDMNFYTYEGLKALLDYYDEDAEFDPDQIYADCAEYGDGAGYSLDDLIYDYGDEYPVEKWLEDNGLEENQFNKDQYIKSLVKRLEEKQERTVLHIKNGNYIVFND